MRLHKQTEVLTWPIQEKHNFLHVFILIIAQINKNLLYYTFMEIMPLSNYVLKFIALRKRFLFCLNCKIKLHTFSTCEFK
jgi:hypothetical protein